MSEKGNFKPTPEESELIEIIADIDNMDPERIRRRVEMVYEANPSRFDQQTKVSPDQEQLDGPDAA